MNATRPISHFQPRFPQNRYMYRIDGCESSPLIQYMCKSVQSSFDNCSINFVYSCTLKLKWLGKGLLSLTKNGPISRTAVFLVYRKKRYLMKYVVFIGTKNFRFHLSHGDVRHLKVV